MLTRIGKPAPAADAVGALLECHDRIRGMTSLAVRLGRMEGLPPADVVDAATRVHRYFSRALPLHARDEEESLIPRLAGREAELDRALADMAAEHRQHDEPVGRVVALCAELIERPERHAELAPSLADAAHELEGHFADHLEREERVIFPAARRLLAPRDLEHVREEIRARRGGAEGAH